jgi:hypothetical protein
VHPFKHKGAKASDGIVAFRKLTRLRVEGYVTLRNTAWSVKGYAETVCEGFCLLEQNLHFVIVLKTITEGPSEEIVA